MRKILVSLLVVSMLLGLVGTAYAGGFSDTTDANVNKAAAYGWVGGYADGTFKPEGNITRAEAAKMIVSAMGLTAAADAAKGLAPKFTDVPATHWASGYINVCVAQGVLKGYADGTFKPEANITGAEIVTMIVRGLKRESEAIGDWPVGHVTVAAANNIIGTGFAASALATRVDVAKWLVNAAAVTTLKLETAGWTDSGKTWLTNKFEDKSGSVTAVDSTKNTITLGGTKYDLSSNYIVGGGKTLAQLIGYVCDAIYDPIAKKITYVAVKTNVTVKTGTVSAVIGTDYFYLDGDATKYTVAVSGGNLTLLVYRNGVAIANNDKANLAAAGIAAATDIEFFANSSNVVSYIVSNAWAKKDLKVKEVVSATSPNSITVTDGVDDFKYYVPSTAAITLNSAAAALTEIKKDMYANVAIAPGTADVTTLEVGNKTVSGKVTAIRTVTATGVATAYYVTVGGVEYKIATADPATDQTTMKNSTSTLTLTLNLAGKVVSFSGATDSKPYVKVIRFEEDGTGTTAPNTKWIVDLKGVTTTYETEDATHTNLINPAGKDVDPGEYVVLTINGGTGLITDATVLTFNAIDKIVSVYTGPDDSQVTMTTAVGGVTQFLAPTKVVEYVDGAYVATNLAKDQYIEFALDPVTNKIAAVKRDTVVEYDSAYKISPVAGSLVCLAGAVEANAKVTFYSDVLRTTALNFVAADVAVGTPGADDNILNASVNGAFTLAVPGAWTTVYATIEDASHNKMDVAWTVTR